MINYPRLACGVRVLNVRTAGEQDLRPQYLSRTLDHRSQRDSRAYSLDISPSAWRRGFRQSRARLESAMPGSSQRS